MISTGTRAITTEASAINVDKSRPKDELINPHSSIANRDLKNTLALLSKLQGKYETAKNKNTVRISTG